MGGLTWHKSAVPLLQHFLPFLEGHHVLVRPDNITVVAYLNKEGGLRSTSSTQTDYMELHPISVSGSGHIVFCYMHFL